MRVSEGVLPTPKEPRTDPPTRDVDAPTPAWKRWWCAPLGPVELQFRRDTVEPAVWTTLLVCPPVAIYAVLARPHAQAIALCILCGLTAAGSILTLRLPWDRYVRSPWREAYYGTWWVVDFSMIVIATVLGGGPTSPLLLLAFIQLVFTAISYPEASVVVATALTVLTLIALAIVYAEPVATTLITATAFAGTGLMAYLGARNHDRRARVLSDSEHRLAEAQAIAHMGSWEWRSDTGRLEVSAELRRIFGALTSDGEQTARQYLDQVHPGDRDELERVFREATQRGGPFSIEHRLVRGDGGDGEIRSIMVHATSAVDRAGVTQISGVCQDITELRRVEARLRYHADHDPLTGLLSRRRLVAELDRHLGFGERRVRGGALVLIDIDGFGIFNDSYGQAAGDLLLRSIADTLMHRLRASDLIARTGGDEFGIVLADTTADTAAATAQELRALLGECAGESTITASLGIACFGPGSDLVGDDVLVAADIALHEAKDGGRNRVSVYRGQNGPDMTWMQSIRTALEQDRFVLHAQPIVDLASGAVSHHELLIRMRGDDGRLIAPDAFLPTAERFGLINAIDRWVGRTAVSLAAVGHRVALNLSAHSIGDAEILRIAQSAVEEGVDPASLIFEITETAAIANLQEARGFATALAGIGCELAIDDFGTGFGSLTYLKHIPARYVKIDREFIKDLTLSPTDQHVVRAVVGIARSLGQRTVAEGVENAETLALVRQLGVDYVQGFFTGRPAQIWPEPANTRPLPAAAA